MIFVDLDSLDSQGVKNNAIVDLVHIILIPWVVLPPSNSDHQDDYIFSRGSL